jgi:hypothetical protein
MGGAFQHNGRCVRQRVCDLDLSFPVLKDV